MFDATEVVPINFVFFTTSAIIAGVFHHYLTSIEADPHSQNNFFGSSLEALYCVQSQSFLESKTLLCRRQIETLNFSHEIPKIQVISIQFQ